MSLETEAERVRARRKAAGLEGLVRGLEFAVINVQPELQADAAEELLRTTGHFCRQAYEDEDHRDFVLSTPGSADLVVRSRRRGKNPFGGVNSRRLTARLPDTRLETFVFLVEDLPRYAAIQRGRGIKFLTPRVVENDKYFFIQTPPSAYTGNSTGFVQWKGAARDFLHSGARELPRPVKPDLPYLKNIGCLDHAATRVTAENRDRAMLEFMDLTGYNFEFAVYVEELNSITNVTRVTETDFALVFTSGIKPFVDEASSGPTEKFVHLYGARTHHLAFDTENIEDTFAALARDGMKYLIELVGSEQEGLKQTFTVPSRNTFLVNEYIHRYGDFDGFFTRSNVTALTRASGNIPND
ncbi:MAG: hypothetical protein A2X32_09805 [Elusimicrobia bacterium GWC2_64_44]|nr:MAG: hypothetical protein A2X32_09805 [Elusimicrobia bacterium GWC2_64_44]